MSKDFEKIKKYYDNGLWNKVMVRNIVLKGIITEDEYFDITFEEFENNKEEIKL